jgi:L-threonylcarbamoyladenylate synthase
MPATRITAPDAAGIAHAADILRGGGLVGMPTETVYGLAADATNPVAVAEVFDAKARPSFDPLIVHAADAEGAFALAADVPALARDLAAACWPGPLTIVLPKTPAICDLVTSGLATVALRVPAHRVAQQLIAAANVPVAAPSANRFGHVSPTTAQHVLDELAEAVDVVIDGGACVTGVESTVVALREQRVHVLRLGGTTVEALTEVVGEGRIEVHDARAAPGEDPQRPASPGMLEKHYAPRTPLTVVGDAAALSPEPRTGLLILSPPADASGRGAVEVLSAKGDLREAAANLFAALRRLDASGVERIVAVAVPEVGLGRAINDRLRRAAR